MNKKDELFRVTEALRKFSFLYTTWIRDALNGELANILPPPLPPPPLCISTEKGNATKLSTLSHVNNLSIIGLEGHRAGGKKRKWRIGREGCQDPAQLGQDVERVAPVNVPTTTTGKGTLCSNEFSSFLRALLVEFSPFASNFVRIVATSQHPSRDYRWIFPNPRYSYYTNSNSVLVKEILQRFPLGLENLIIQIYDY